MATLVNQPGSGGQFHLCSDFPPQTAAFSLPLPQLSTPRENADLLNALCVSGTFFLQVLALSCVRSGKALLGLTLKGLDALWSPARDAYLQGAPNLGLVPPWGFPKAILWETSRHDQMPSEYLCQQPQSGQGLSCPVESAFLGKPERLLGHQDPEGSWLSQDCGQCWPQPGLHTPSCGGLSAREVAL